MSNTPTVSIGLPVYNGGAYLAPTIETLLAQSYTDFELILSDNASTDGSEEVCRHYAAQDARIRYYRNDTNIGGAGNHTRTVQLARGALFKWCGADDLYDPAYLATCVPLLERQPAVVLCYPQASVIDDDSNFVREYDDHFHLVGLPAHERLLRVLAHDNALLFNPSLGVIRTEALRRTLPMGKYYASDRVLLAQLAVDGEFCEAPERLLFRRVYTRKQNWTAGTEEEVAGWFDATAKAGVLGPRFQKFWGYWNAIRQAQQPASVKAACYRTLLEFYFSGDRVPGMVLEARSLYRVSLNKLTGQK